MIAELINHLWQSTLFAVAAALLTLAFRHNRAGVRYRIWLGASLKFLVPFALLISLGGHLRPVPQPKAIASQTVSFTVAQIAQPFHQGGLVAPPVPRVDWLPIVLWGLWACGFLCIVAIRFRGWIQIRAAIGSGSAVDVAAAIPVRATPGLLEPGVVGLFRSVLLIPGDIMERLTPAQLAAVIAHETEHVRRRDNLTAAMQMVVETLFWFHPFVWWIGAQMIAERERACDEAVLGLGFEPGMYAESIVQVCRSYVSSPLPCASGVSGADMKKRIRAILAGNVPRDLTVARKSVLATAAVAAIAGPVAIGVMTAPALHAQFRSGPAPRFAASFIKPCELTTTGRGGRGGGVNLGSSTISVDSKGNFVIPDIPARLYVGCGTAKDMIHAAYAMFAGGHLNQSVVERPDRVPVEGPAWIATEHYTVDAIPESAQNQDTINGPMLQGLLEERFQLKVHSETRQVQGYVLTVASGGFKAPPFNQGECLPLKFGQLKAAGRRAAFAGWVIRPEPLPENFCPNHAGGFEPTIQAVAHGVTLDEFAETYLFFDNKPVVNRTGIKGLYNFDLEIATADPVNSAIAALNDQLGIKVELAMLPRQVLVVDSIQRPAEN